MFNLSRNAPCHCGSGRKYKKCCLARDEAEAGAAQEPAPAVLQDMIDDVLDELGPDVSEQELLAALNVRMAEQVDAYNAAPQPELGGLSPIQVQRLMQSTWDDPNDAFYVRSDLPALHFNDSALVHNARTLLGWAVEENGLPLTETGNLNLKTVARAMEALRFQPGYIEFLTKYAKRTLEDQVPALQLQRITLELAGLLRRRGRLLKAPTEAKRLLEPAHTGELAALLFRTFFRKLNLELADRMGGWPEFQHGVAFSIYQFARHTHEFSAPEDLVDVLLLPHALDRAPVMPTHDWTPWALYHRLLEPLAHFGLAERRAVPGVLETISDWHYRRTRLCDEFLQFAI